MTPENVTRYRVKTNRGYYFTESNGRYARFYGSSLRAEVVCAVHADEIVAKIGGLVPELQMEREDYPGNAPCATCKRLAHP